MKPPSPQAVALRYDSGRDAAPRVVAKGSGRIAERIVDAARQRGIPLVANPIAADLLAQTDLNAEVAPEFYQAVAEILAFVYRLDDSL
jgi:flagellar biosynthesis protein